MNELTDLEICIKIAEIKGEVVEHITDKYVFISRTEYSFNPIDDKEFCWNLMIDDEIMVGIGGTMIGVKGYSASTFTQERCQGKLIERFDIDPQRALCLAYIAKWEANNG